jgi:phage host-nuclease inhibitor protein Gam
MKNVARAKVPHAKLAKETDKVPSTMQAEPQGSSSESTKTFPQEAGKPMSAAETSHPMMSADLDRSQVLRGGGGNVDKIRDILFGSQMRDYESRFARLEETLVKENAEIRETNRRRFEQLESYIKKEFESLQARLKAERDERLDGATQHSRELKDLNDALSRRIRDLDDRSSGVERELRGQLMDQARQLTDEIRATQDQIVSVLEKRYHELKDGKTDRAALATLFTEVALRLSDQFLIPGSEE